MHGHSDYWTISGRPGSIVATAVHDGHALRATAARWMQLGEAERLREEDPFTGSWTSIGDVRIVAGHSRFEVDFNRARDKAVYRTPQDAWGLTVWSPNVPPRLFDESLAIYDAFYGHLDAVLTDLIRQFGHVVVLDLHSYNHRRPTPDATADPREAPDINIGTSNMDRRHWVPIVDTLLRELSASRIGGRHPDVRENVRFQGGHLVRWIHDRFGPVCAMAIEVKKTFMDEWSGEPDPAAIDEIARVLGGTVPALRAELARY